MVYYDVNDREVTPRQHIIRALGGPIFNLLLLPVAWSIKHFSKEESALRDIGNALFATNAFIGIGGFLPIPIIDGGPIVKWSLVEKGMSIEKADITVQKINGVLGAGLTAATAISTKNKQWTMAGIFGMFAISALGVAIGLLKEQA